MGDRVCYVYRTSQWRCIAFRQAGMSRIIDMQLHEKLQLLRKQKGLSQELLAEQNIVACFLEDVRDVMTIRF